MKPPWQTRETTPPESDLYAQFFNRSLELLCIADLDGYFKKVNPAFCTLLGYSEEELLAVSFLELLHPDDLAPTLQVMEEQREGLHTASFENRYRKKNGQYCWLSWSAWVDRPRRLTYAVARESAGRKSYEKALAVSHRDIATVLDSIADGFFSVDQDWKVLYWNHQAEVLTGKGRAEVLGCNLWDCFPEEVGRIFYTRHQEAMQSQTTDRFEGYLQQVGRWLEVSAYPSQEGLSVYFRDIDDRKRKEQALERMNEQYRLLTKATGGVVWDWNLENGRTYYYEDNFKNMLGHDVVDDSLPYDYWATEILHPEDRPHMFAGIEKALEEKSDYWSSHYRLKRADGSYAWVHARGFVQKDAGGNPVNMVGFTQDISAQKEAELELLAREERYRELFNNAPLPQVIVDGASLRLLKVNEAALRHYGYTEAEFLCLGLADLYAPGEQEHVQALVRSLQTNSSSVYTEGLHRKKSGEALKVELSAVSITYRDRPAFLVSLNDVTEKRRLQEKLVRLRLSEQKKMTRAQIRGQEQERLAIGRELHDNINQQLTSVKLLLDLAHSTTEIQGALIERAEGLLQNAISEIRSLSRSLVSPALYDVGLCEAIKDLVATYELSRPFAVELVYDCPGPAFPQELNIMLYRVIQEQLVNITRHAGATKVFIGVERQEDFVALRLRDNGKGFDPQKKRKGIGLTNIKSRVELCSGILNLHSAEGKGCELLVRVPLDSAGA